MTTPDGNPDELLAQVAGGRLDELTPEQVAALEAHLNATPAAAERLADVVPASDPGMSHMPAPPSATEWDELWERVDSALPVRKSAPREVGRVIRLWEPLAAVAACLLLMILWRAGPAPAQPAWEMRLSDHVVVHELEVFGDASSFVAYSDDDSGTAVIWVIEEGEEQQGA